LAQDTRLEPSSNNPANVSPTITTGTVQIIQQAPPPESESERVCLQTRGVEPGDWRAFLRHLGVPAVEVKRGLTVARTADIDEALRRLGRPLAKRASKPTAAPVEPTASALERAGLRKGAA
jgi:hypothetical protein